MIDVVLTAVFLAAGNAALWLLILNRRARRYVIKGLIARYGTKDAREEIATGDAVTLCVANVFEMAFALLTVAGALQLSRK